MRKSMFLLSLAGSAVIAAYANAKRRAAAQTDAPQPQPQPRVRDAGPDAMTSPPRRWDTTDQQADESFPASDPPGNY